MVEKLTQIKGLYLKVYVKFSGLIQVYLQKLEQNSNFISNTQFEFRLRVCKWGHWFWVLVVLMSRLLYVGSLGVLCLAYIIGGGLWGVGAGTLGIWGVGAGMWAGRGFGVGVFSHTPFTKHRKWSTFQA